MRSRAGAVGPAPRSFPQASSASGRRRAAAGKPAGPQGRFPYATVDAAAVRVTPPVRRQLGADPDGAAIVAGRVVTADAKAGGGGGTRPQVVPPGGKPVRAAPGSLP